MSIIQEALEKARSSTKPIDPGAGITPAPKKIENPRAAARPVMKKAVKLPTSTRRALMAATLLAVMAFAIFSAGRFLSNISNRPDRTSAAKAQEVSYRPLVKNKASLSNADTETDRTNALVAGFKKTQNPELVLNGIMYIEEEPRAIINNFIVKTGDSVGGAVITNINSQSVILEYEDVEITLSLK
jgi:hypothetical protein